jgi:hypothetical protein
VSRSGQTAAASRRLADALRRQQRAFDVNEMHIAGLVDAGLGQCRPDRGYDYFDLLHPAAMAASMPLTSSGAAAEMR